MSAIERLQAALLAKERGRGQLVEITAADLREACELAADPACKIVAGLHQGVRAPSVAGMAEQKVTIQADDLFHLIEKASK